MMQKIYFLLILIFLVAGCTKNKDEQAPVITITTPADNQNFTSGQSVNIIAAITDDVELHEVHLFVTNNATGADVLHFETHADVARYDLNKTFAAQTGITYKIKIQASDHAGNKGEKQIMVNGK